MALAESAAAVGRAGHPQEDFSQPRQLSCSDARLEGGYALSWLPSCPAFLFCHSREKRGSRIFVFVAASSYDAFVVEKIRKEFTLAASAAEATSACCDAHQRS